MDSKSSLEDTNVHVFDSLRDIEKKSEIMHSEHATSAATAPPSITKVPASTDLTPKQQYQQLWTNLKKDKHFVLWALYVMSLVFGWGYDQGLSGVAIAFPEFRKVYVPWNAASTIGQVFGAFLTGQFADYTGRKPILLLAVMLSLAASFALVFAPNLPVLFVSKLLLGFSVGFSTATPPLYVTENSPAPLRSSMSSLTIVIIVLGFFLSSLTGFGASKISGPWSFRLAFCMTFLIPGLFLFGLPFLPESPVWYMKKRLEGDARKAVIQLFGKDSDVEEIISAIKKDLEIMEGEAQHASQTSWKAIFTKPHLSRTLVAVLGLQSQNFSGGYFANTYQTYFELIGQSDPFGLTAISSTLQFLANCVAVLISDVLPRRKALIGGGTILVLWSVIIALMLSSVFPYFINPDQLNWGGKVMFLFVGAEIFILLGLFFYQPETKNRTYGDIDILYASSLSPMKFTEWVVVDGVAVRKGL